MAGSHGVGAGVWGDPDFIERWLSGDTGSEALRAPRSITAALVALSMSGTTVRTYDVMSAAVLIGALPPLLVYFFGGKYFVRGLTQGAIK